ncbi:MAG: hypothetical protein HRU28_14450 [Rhizobiales bacterium]|nr:hypothetical protein [Hyphomicrobiales bacterium]
MKYLQIIVATTLAFGLVACKSSASYDAAELDQPLSSIKNPGLLNAAIMKRIIGKKVSNKIISGVMSKDNKITGILLKNGTPFLGRWHLIRGKYCSSFYKGLHIKHACTNLRPILNKKGKITAIETLFYGKPVVYQLASPA